MKQLSFFAKTRGEHGGTLALSKRRSRRPINIKNPVHLILRSDLAKGSRSLLKNKALVLRILQKFSRRFRIRVYEKAVCGNHIHLVVKADTHRDLQNFFRVFAGQVAQEILRDFPLQKHEEKAFVGPRRGGTPMHLKNQRTFWSLLLYSRIVGWGRDFQGVIAYVIQNTKEALGLVAYKKRKTPWRAVPPTGRKKRRRASG
jgi:REP element-mobilizing transposase RayT